MIDIYFARFPVGLGVAGTVARTGRSLNLVDAYRSKYFSCSVDHQTGYTTKSLYTSPITVRGTVLAVLQFVNKEAQEDIIRFSREDEEVVEQFSAYLGLALHHAKLYDKIRKNEAKTSVRRTVQKCNCTLTVYRSLTRC